jgi:hypothetical protein
MVVGVALVVTLVTKNEILVPVILILDMVPVMVLLASYVTVMV